MEPDQSLFWHTEKRKVSDLKAFDKNPRKLTEQQKQHLTRSLKKFNLVEIPAVDSDGTIIAGHQRLSIMKALGRADEEIDVRVPNRKLTDEEFKEYNLRSNKNTGEWDNDLLACFGEEMLKDVGFGSDEIDKLFPVEASEKDDQVPEVAENEYGVKRGDIWKLGRHRLMCGDATSQSDIALLMDGKKAQMVHTDPPYNVDYSNADRPKASKTDLGKIANDMMSVDAFKVFISDVLKRADEATQENASIYLWYASASASAILLSFDESNWKRNQEVIWKKPMLLGRSRYQWAHEPCIFAVKGSPYFTDDRTKTTIWDFGGYDKSKNVHPTQKPVILCEEAIQNSSERENIVLDLFLGSGSTLIACEKTDRICYGTELTEHYCSVIIKRWEQFTGKKAERIVCGQ